ncbi:LysR family transcriptional regulator [Roseateles koreensis]|uniref:LysR family transcriptional regulator n=1 Tax=Roseateles koreensis TaxID=2987526 RepID=A0ABT5KQF8_9BURK|nr:LysR family transcriptional regulator [Roseateles koreensis]MDC8785160.1 LysR family transcriptional regulator [Roseateles koreensis]
MTTDNVAMIDLRHLRHALALAEHRSFARAANACHITQSALTRSIQALETSLDAKLFDRHREGIEPTELGKLVLRYALNLDSTSRELERELRLAQGLEVGELTIGVGLYGGLSLITPVVAQLNQLQPALKVRIHVAPWSVLPISARARETDVIVVERSQIQESGDFEHTAMSEHPAVLICRPAHPLLQLPSCSTQDLLQYPSVGPLLSPDVLARLCERDPAASEAIVQASDQAVTQCDSAALIKELVMSTDALSAMYPFMVDRELASGQLRALPQIKLGVHASFAAAWLSARPLSAAAATFIELLRAQDLRFSNQARTMIAVSAGASR